MPVRITDVAGKSRFFRNGDEIVSIDGMPVEDQLDILFLTGEEQRSAHFAVRRADGTAASRLLTIRSFVQARLVFEAMQFKRCRSRCIFCFVDQMPPGLRPTLYEKDDDYRLSFLYGNYITLNDVGDREIERMLSLHLSPLYVSVHAVRRRVRERLFGRHMRGDLLETISRLAGGGVTIHAQVVLLPGVNDGPILDETVDALFDFYPAVRSVAVVPVGLTRHRDTLPRIERVGERTARALIRWAEKRRDSFVSLTGGDHFLCLSDEWYLLARRKLPPLESYGELWQLANGVGMCRTFLESIRQDVRRLRDRKSRPVDMTIVTGTLGGRFLRRYVLPLLASHLPAFAVKLLVVRNRLFGSSVGVSGLLAGRDIINAFRRRGTETGCLVLPPNAVNYRGLLIDDFSPDGIGRKLGFPVLVPECTFLEDRIVQTCGGGTR